MSAIPPRTTRRTGPPVWMGEMVVGDRCPLHGPGYRCPLHCGEPREAVPYIPVAEVAVAWRALERVRDKWIGHALDMANRCVGLRAELEAAEHELTALRVEVDLLARTRDG